MEIIRSLEDILTKHGISKILDSKTEGGVHLITYESAGNNGGRLRIDISTLKIRGTEYVNIALESEKPSYMVHNLLDTLEKVLVSNGYQLYTKIIDMGNRYTVATYYRQSGRENY